MSTAKPPKTVAMLSGGVGGSRESIMFKKIFFGVATMRDVEELRKVGINRLLISFPYARDIFKWPVTRHYLPFKTLFNNPNLELMLDSGAFTAWRNRKQINIEQYAHFIKAHNAEFYVNLDVIGNAEKTWENQKWLESKGLTPLPVFHYGEDMKWLDMYCQNYDYVGIGGIAKRPVPQRLRFLKTLKENYPHTKFHLFGVTDFNSLKMDFYSADSTSYLGARIYGDLILDKGRVAVGMRRNVKKIAEKIDYLQKKCQQYGLSLEKILSGDVHEQTLFNVLEIKQFEVGEDEVEM